MIMGGGKSYRDLQLDGLKFVMIFFVVLGHLSYYDYGIGIKKIICAFYMPVFIFLSGYFTSQNTNKEKQIKWLKQTFLIYIVAQLAHSIPKLIISYALSIQTNELFDTTLLWKVLISPNLALWYLICLIYWRLSVWQIFNLTSDFKLIIISCSLALVSGFIPIDHEFSFQRAFSFFPFFVVGMIFRKHNLMQKLNKTPYMYALVVLLIGFVVARYLPVYMPKYHYSNLYHPFLRIAQSCLGLVLCLSILRVTRIDYIKKFAKYGIYTLWIYIGHTYLIVIGQVAFPFLGISLNIISALVLTSIYCTIFIYMAQLYYSRKKKQI